MYIYENIVNDLILAILLVTFAYVCIGVWQRRDDVNHKLRLQGWTVHTTLWSGTVYMKEAFVTTNKLLAIEYEAQLERNKLGIKER